MTFKDLKNMDFNDADPVEYVITKLLYDKKLDFITISNSYVTALQAQVHLSNSQFNEACVCILQLLNGNFNGDNLTNIQKRAIHIYNKNRTLFRDVLNEQYGYTKEDFDKWEEFCNNTYGTQL